LQAGEVGIASGCVRFLLLEVDHRPAGIQDPEDIVPGIVPVELILTCTLQRAMD
jgi:hypothetical protein